MNLGSNSAQAMRGAEGVLDVSLVPFNADDHSVAEHPALQRGIYARLTVSDNGSGIPDEISERVFEPFFSSGREGKGTGLGLWLVKDMVSAMRGTIELRSREGEGTTIDIFLPAATPADNTVVPSAWRISEPAPSAIISGTTPRMKAKEVIRIGRRRVRAASIAASMRSRPSRFRLARELDDQDGVLGRQPDQHHQADLGQDIVVPPALG